MFVDRVKVSLRAGRGGDGCISFRREKGVPRGGPDGGRGGKGGNIYLVSDKNINSLVYFRFNPLNKAGRGTHGQGGNRQGKKGEDLYLEVPVGTVVKNTDKERVIFDFSQSGQKYLAARGGKGGRGNASYVTSTHQSPEKRERGEPGEEKEYVLELKLIAEVGLVGFPNTGKSTLLSRVTAAKPHIAAYPFTTLTPHLGVVDVDEFQSFVMADIPGLIEGAHSGHGLGIKFLKHIERTNMLVHVIDVSPYTQRDPAKDYEIVRKELQEFNPLLAEKTQVIVANKIDLLRRDKIRLEKVKCLAQRKGIPFFAVSALKKAGLKELVFWLGKNLEERENKAERIND